PPSAAGSTWLRRLGEHETAFASGWMRLRGARRRRGMARGFVLSDHADWPALLQTIAQTGARRVYATHGYSDVLARHLRELGYEAAALRTLYEGEAED
ncbi:MAG: DNA ligase-associated DEXH box helicase, partial [Armatimonadetes bacterium]|nr:DNA ligase-associated DEXH box helicase [Armatimonadota bacterium]